MTKALRAALLSGLVFPGAGQMYLKRYKSGLLYLVIAMGALVAMILPPVRLALTILDQLAPKGGTLDMAAISRASAEVSAVLNSAVFQLGLWVLVACWAVATIDAYRIGKRMGGADRPPEQTG